MKMPVALLQVNRFFYDEVTACLQQYIDLGSTTLLCRHTPRLSPYSNCLNVFVPGIMRMLSVGSLYDTLEHKNFNSRSAQNVDIWTLKGLVLYLKSFTTRLQTYLELGYVWKLNYITLRAFLRYSFVKLRRQPGLEVQLRYVVDKIAHVDNAESLLEACADRCTRVIELPLGYTMVVPGASPEDFSMNDVLRLPNAMELELLNGYHKEI
jgi:hypothetical protein